MNFRRLLPALLCLAALAGLGGGSGNAQTYPAKTIHIISSAQPGGTIDLMARILADKFAADFGQSAVVENKGGAAGNVATEYVAKSKPDGYTLLMVAVAHATNLNLYSGLEFDPVKSFAPISELVSDGLFLAVPTSSPANSFKDFLALAKSRAEPLNYSSAGSGQGSHLGMELLKRAAGFEAVHVPYRGTGPAALALLNGSADVALLTLPALLESVKAGKLKLLATTAAKRSPLAADVPTVAELGYPGFQADSWIGLLAPAGTPKEVVDLLYRESAKALRQPDVAEKLARFDLQTVASTPAEFAAFLQSEIDKWAVVIKASGAKAE
jgi:tripartite-type tricarboxylate transporter receptor subunit TctC